MRGLSAKSRIALGQTGLMTSLVLGAIFLGLVPDRVSALRESRAALAEAIAANSTVFVTHADIRRLEATLRLVVERNADIRSAAVRRAKGDAVVTVGEHAQHWRDIPGQYSTDSQLEVPIWAGDEKWGQIELRFRPLTASGWLGLATNPRVQLTGFVGLSSFVVFYFYLGKMLKHLDPSQAIPGRVRAALDTMVEGLLVVDRKEQIVLANQAFASMVGKAADELVGFRASDFPWTTTDGASLTLEACPWAMALREGVPQKDALVRLQLSGSTRRAFMVNCSPVLGSGGKPGGVLISLDDVTQLEQKEIELRRSKDEAEAANRAKSEFLANMSHEIRTPMNAILGYTEVLKRGYGKGRQDSTKYLNNVHSSGTHLLDLINDILDLSKVESGRLQVERTRCAPHVIIHDVLQIFVLKTQEKGISLDFEADGAVPESILSDPARLRQILTNLVGNAIKFTEKGGVKVVTRLGASDEKQQLAIDVIDTGIGMPEEKLGAIFDPFVQADSSITRRFGGTGLGLAISRRFAQALHGDITVRSERGKGSVFTVTVDTGPLDDVRMLLPRDVQMDSEEAVAEAQVRWEFPPARVLVVDDGTENRELVSLILEEVGLLVDTAENGRVGVDKALEQPFDVILMDVQMPVMDGYTAVRTLRQRGLQIPIIALTAHAMKEVEQACLEAGFSGHATKPIDIDGLIQTLAGLVGGRRAEYVERGGPSTQPEADDATDGGPSEAAAPIVSRLPTTNPRIAAIIQRFVQRLGEQLEAMEGAFRERDFDGLAGLAHWLKGGGGSVGFDEFTEPAQYLEQLAKERTEGPMEAAIADLRRLAERIVVPNDGETQATATPESAQARVAVTTEPSPAVRTSRYRTGTRSG